MNPTNVQTQRVKKQKEVKSRIQQIMSSVKQEKQHIENQLATNDHKIQLYSQQYQTLKSKHDFSHLTPSEEILLKQLIKGLEENKINPKQIIGGQQVGLNIQNYQQSHPNIKKHKKLNKQQIIAVQTLLIDQLTQQLKAKQLK